MLLVLRVQRSVVATPPCMPGWACLHQAHAEGAVVGRSGGQAVLARRCTLSLTPAGVTLYVVVLSLTYIPGLRARIVLTLEVAARSVISPLDYVRVSISKYCVHFYLCPDLRHGDLAHASKFVTRDTDAPPLQPGLYPCSWLQRGRRDPPEDHRGTGPDLRGACCKRASEICRTAPVARGRALLHRPSGRRATRLSLQNEVLSVVAANTPSEGTLRWFACNSATVAVAYRACKALPSGAGLDYPAVRLRCGLGFFALWRPTGAPSGGGRRVPAGQVVPPGRVRPHPGIRAAGVAVSTTHTCPTVLAGARGGRGGGRRAPLLQPRAPVKARPGADPRGMTGAFVCVCAAVAGSRRPLCVRCSAPPPFRASQQGCDGRRCTTPAANRGHLFYVWDPASRVLSHRRRSALESSPRPQPGVGQRPCCLSSVCCTGAPTAQHLPTSRRRFRVAHPTLHS